MDDVQMACELLGLEEKWLQPFDVCDPFNDDLRLEGLLSLKPDHRYGALALLRVGGQVAPQRILATPKLHYPFGRDGQFHFPPIKTVEIYEKLDGTNVLAYQYADAAGNRRVTYKLRLYPVLRNSKWGPFLDLWQEMLERYPRLHITVQANNCHVSFELYGARNPHLVLYDEPLDCALLFGVGEDGQPMPPSRLDCCGLPAARLWGTLAAGRDPVAEYSRIREQMESQLAHLDNEKFKGTEGTVWYVTSAGGRVVLFKCKPESVEAMHWAAGINKQAVLATCWNVLETQDVLSYETLVPLLREEYGEQEIEAFRGHIDECMAAVSEELAFRHRVLAAYQEIGISLLEDKRACMRALSPLFGRNEMKHVFSVLNAHVASPTK